MQDYANQIAQMFVGYQITLVDMPRLVAKGHGRLEVDLFADKTTLNGEPTLPLSISNAVRSWYEDAIVRDHLGETFVHQIQITCDFDITDAKHGDETQRRVILDCTVAVETDSGPWEAGRQKSEMWHRTGDQPWTVRDL